MGKVNNLIITREHYFYCGLNEISMISMNGGGK